MHEAGMTDESRLALIIAFYLSKYNTAGLTRLGYYTFAQAFSEIGKQLGIKPQSLKNKRDDFDPFYSNGRVGWHQRDLGPSRLKTLRLLDDLNFDALAEFVKDIISDIEYRRSAEVRDILSAIKRGRTRDKQFIPRGNIGRIAEELFKEWFEQGKTPFSGIIEDKRDDGCGYDFRIRDGEVEHLIEVKGVSEPKGGVLFTDKEWQIAQDNTQYSLALVTNLRNNPKLYVFNNPSVLFTPRRIANLSVRIEWQVPAAQILSSKE